MNKRNILIISIATIVPATIGLVICQNNVSPFHITKADTKDKLYQEIDFWRKKENDVKGGIDNAGN